MTQQHACGTLEIGVAVVAGSKGGEGGIEREKEGKEARKVRIDIMRGVREPTLLRVVSCARREES